MSRSPIHSSAPPQQDITGLLHEAQRGGAEAGNRLLPLVYERLRELAQQRMAGERAGHTLDATSLVHEAYLRLVGVENIRWNDQAHFFFAAAEAMRRILIDHARARSGLKRGGGGSGRRRRVPFNNVLDLAKAQEHDAAEILALDEALLRLESDSPSVAAVVKLRFFAGLSIDQAAASMGVSPRTVKREWTYARAWLARELRCDDAGAAAHE